MKKIDLFKVFMAPTAAEEVTKVINSGYIGQGPKVNELEEMMKTHFNHDYVSTVNAGTSALHLALHLLKKPSTDIFLSATIKYRKKEYDIDINKFSILGADIFKDIFIKWYFYYFKGKTIKDADMKNITVSILDSNVNNIVIDYKKYIHINEDDKEPYYSIKDCD